MNSPREWEWDIVGSWAFALAWCYGIFSMALHHVLPWLIKLRIF